MVKDVLILVAKHPTKGKSKTRLARSLGDDVALKFADALLEDTMERLGGGEDDRVVRVLFFAPVEAENMFRERCKRLSKDWNLIPMPPKDLGSKSLTDLLKYALNAVRERFGKEIVVSFCGMDSPTLSLDTIRCSMRTAQKGNAHIVPANDGGYVMLTLPVGISPDVFENVTWSSEDTLMTQRNQIRNLGTDVETSQDVHIDVDELQDLLILKRKCKESKTIRNGCSRTYHLLKKLNNSKVDSCGCSARYLFVISTTIFITTAAILKVKRRVL
jgi:uncharacterized protein